MTTKELIRAEIERLKSKYRHNGLWTSSFQSDLAMAKIESMNELLSFLDTLPDEPVKDCGDLEKEIKEQIYDRFYDLNGIAVIGTSGYAEVKDMEYIARHFAEWQKKQLLKSSPLPEDTVLFNKGVAEGRKLEREEMPKWRNYGPNIIKDPFITDLGSLVVGEKCIRIYELYNLPGFKND